MVHFIKLHTHVKREINQMSILVNPDNISYIKPLKDGGSHIIFCCSDNQNYQGVSVIESLEEIISIIKAS